MTGKNGTSYLTMTGNKRTTLGILGVIVIFLMLKKETSKVSHTISKFHNNAKKAGNKQLLHPVYII